MDDRRNVVLITIDAWRPDFVDECGGVRLLPRLDRWADRTVRFDRAYATAPWTSAAIYAAAPEHCRALGVEEVPPHLADSVGSGFVVPRHQFTLDPADRDIVRRSTRRSCASRCW